MKPNTVRTHKICTAFARILLVAGLFSLPALATAQSSRPAVTAMAAGLHHSLFLTSDGVLWGMGSNIYLGINTYLDQHPPIPVATNVIAVSAGDLHSMFVTDDGTLWAMGNNSYGQLGDGTTTSRLNTPVQVATNVIAVAAGGRHSLYLTRDGTLWAVGSNENGQLGDGTISDRLRPVAVATNVTAIAAGFRHSLYLTSNDELWGMGDNSSNQLHTDKSTPNRITPIRIATNIAIFSAGDWSTLYAAKDGVLWARGTYGSVIQGPAAQVAVNVIAVSGGYGHCMYVTNDGKLWGMGMNGYGQLGTGNTDFQYNIPVSVMTNVASVMTDEMHSLFVSRNGSLWAMGNNSSGQLGDGTTTRKLSPVLIYDATAEPPALSVSPKTAQIINANAGTLDFTVTNTGTTSMPWMAEITASGTWARVTSSTFGTNSGVITVAYDANPPSGAQRTATLRITAHGSTNSPLTITLEQAANPIPPIPPSNPAPLATTQPVVAGRNITFTASADGSPPPAYKWQVSIGGGAWTDLSNTNIYNGVDTASLTITSASADMNNYRYRYIADNGYGTPAISNSLTLRVAPALFPSLSAVARDASGNLYTTDTTTHTIQKITPQLVATPFAGAHNSPGSTDATGTNARFNKPRALAFTPDGNLLVADSGNAAIRRISPAGAVITLTAGFNSPAGIGIDYLGSASSAFVADAGAHTISYMTSFGAVELIAGAKGQPGAIAGFGSNARFNAPTRVLIDPQGHFYIADTGNHLIRTNDVNGIMLLYAGAAGVSGTSDGPATTARFNKPQGMAVDNAGHVYLADTGNHTIRMISNDGEVMTLAGVPEMPGLRDGTGTNALFDHPVDVFYDGAGTLYVADSGNAAIRKVDISSGTVGVVTTLLITSATPPGNDNGNGGDSDGDTGGGGGGGAPSLWWLAAIVALLASCGKWQRLPARELE